MLACWLWFSSFSLVNQRNAPTHALYCPFYYLYNCPKHPPKEKEYIINPSLQQYLNHHLLKSTATGKERISSFVKFVNDQNSLPKSNMQTRIILCASNSLAKHSPSDWDKLFNINILPAWVPWNTNNCITIPQITILHEHCFQAPKTLQNQKTLRRAVSNTISLFNFCVHKGHPEF